MITYENFFFRTKKTFETWKEAIAFAKDEMDYILTHEAVFSKKLVKMADEEYEDLVIASWSSEEDLQKDFANHGFNSDLYKITYTEKENVETQKTTSVWIVSEIAHIDEHIGKVVGVFDNPTDAREYMRKRSNLCCVITSVTKWEMNEACKMTEEGTL